MGLEFLKLDGLNVRLRQGTCDQTQARPDCSDCSVLPRYRGMLSVNMGFFFMNYWYLRILVQSGDFGRDFARRQRQTDILWFSVQLSLD